MKARGRKVADQPNPDQPPSQGTPPADIKAVPVCTENVRTCLDSAGFWVGELPRYADRNQQKADRWAIASGILAAITSLAIWPLVTESKQTWATVLVSLVALGAAVCALVPRIKNYAEMAGQARELASRYGSIYGKLMDLYNMGANFNQPAALQIITEFDATKAKKDALRDLPDKEAILLKRAPMKAKS